MSWRNRKNGCDCDLCKKEADWEERFGVCYRCTHDIWCDLAEEREDKSKCCTVLDVIVAELRTE